jgi:hypothetical protein
LEVFGDSISATRFIGTVDSKQHNQYKNFNTKRSSNEVISAGEGSQSSYSTVDVF